MACNEKAVYVHNYYIPDILFELDLLFIWTENCANIIILTIILHVIINLKMPYMLTIIAVTSWL